jgi:hypothetical protein
MMVASTPLHPPGSLIKKPVGIRVLGKKSTN